VNPATEKKCPHCDAIISFGADVCPQCGTRLTVPPIAKAGGGGKVLKGCLIAAVVGFFGIFVIGIIAAIAIPKFASTKQKAYVAEMRADLRNLATAEEAYHQSHQAYTSNIAELGGYTLSQGVALAEPIDAGADGWAATLTRDPSGMKCTMSVGDRVPAGGAAGTPVCSSEARRAP
jgi:Tfp pilus assembly major pilin PilA